MDIGPLFRCFVVSLNRDPKSPITISSILPHLSILPRSFYLRPTLRIAKDLLGKYLIRKSGKRLLIGKIVEVEAYLGKRDPASHAFRGKTKRNEVMFREGGHLYVYFTYGMHFCANVVTRPEGVGEAVLLRAIEPVEGIGPMIRNRGFGKGLPSFTLTNGPAKLCKAFKLDRSYNGSDLLNGPVRIMRKRRGVRGPIASSTRIGISVGTKMKWRFSVKDNPWVSRKS